jgi:hypothetical protein
MSSEASESLFFPNIDGFDEGMDKSQFRQKYSDIESIEYLGVLDEIERRLSKLPVSRIISN